MACRFESLFSTGLWQRYSLIGVSQAEKLGEMLRISKVPLLRPVESNMVLASLNSKAATALKSEGITFYYPWEGAARFLTTFAHTDEDLEHLVSTIQRVNAR